MAKPTKPTDRWVALLRGINVGGKNVIKMADLCACFEALGATDVTTYIQSGNVVFAATRKQAQPLRTRIETALGKAFDYDSRIVLLSAKDLARVVEQAPPKFGSDAKRYRYDVLFVRDPLTAREALEQVKAKPGVDSVHAGDHALYFRRLIAKATQSQLARLTQRPVYQQLTVRNWNTTTKLLAMVSG